MAYFKKIFVDEQGARENYSVFLYAETYIVPNFYKKIKNFSYVNLGLSSIHKERLLVKI